LNVFLETVDRSKLAGMVFDFCKFEISIIKVNGFYAYSSIKPTISKPLQKCNAIGL
jgi:hypothetical protein